jgi:hypothetical protein
LPPRSPLYGWIFFPSSSKDHTSSKNLELLDDNPFPHALQWLHAAQTHNFLQEPFLGACGEILGDAL